MYISSNPLDRKKEKNAMMKMPGAVNQWNRRFSLGMLASAKVCGFIFNLKRHIKNIIYSKEAIEIKLYEASDFSQATDENVKQILSLPQPKMPPPIFGCGNPTLNDKFGATGNFLGKGKVRRKKTAGRTCDLRTFSIILPNTIHGNKSHLK